MSKVPLASLLFFGCHGNGPAGTDGGGRAGAGGAEIDCDPHPGFTVLGSWEGLDALTSVVGTSDGQVYASWYELETNGDEYGTWDSVKRSGLRSWDGEAWTLESWTDTSFQELWVEPGGRLHAAGFRETSQGTGAHVRWVSEEDHSWQWTAALSNWPMTAIGGLDANDVLIGGNGELWHLYDNQWHGLWKDSDPHEYGFSVYSTWMGEDGVGYAVGVGQYRMWSEEGFTTIQGNTATVVDIDTPGDALHGDPDAMPREGWTGVRGSSPDNVWAVGFSNLQDGSPITPMIVAWDGTGWRSQLPPEGWAEEHLGTAEWYPYGLAVVSTDEVYIAFREKIIRWDGEDWALLDLGIDDSAATDPYSLYVHDLAYVPGFGLLAARGPSVLLDPCVGRD